MDVLISKAETEKRSKQMHREQMYGYQEGRRGWGELEDWGWYIYALNTVNKKDN